MLCPVCNGLCLLAAPCPRCGSASEDEGRKEDWIGPYSPYEPSLLPAAGMTDAAAACQHTASCGRCGILFDVNVGAWHL